MARKTSALAVIDNLPESRQAEIFEWCNTPIQRDADGKPVAGTGGYSLTQQQLADDGIHVSLTALSRWYSRYALSQDMEAAEDVVELVKQIKPGDAKLARECGEVMFQRLAMKRQDAKMFAVGASAEDSRRALVLKESALEHDREKFKAAIRTKLETGLDALFGEIKGNAKAEALFAQLREVVAAA